MMIIMLEPSGQYKGRKARKDGSKQKHGSKSHESAWLEVVERKKNECDVKKLYSRVCEGMKRREVGTVGDNSHI